MSQKLTKLASCTKITRTSLSTFFAGAKDIFIQAVMEDEFDLFVVRTSI
jgi:hypothetical protein